MGKQVKKYKRVAVILVLTMIFSINCFGNERQAMAKSAKASFIKSVTLKIGKKNVTKKNYKLTVGNKKTIQVNVSPNRGKKTVKFATSNKKIAAVSKNGKVTAKRAGTARIKVTVKAAEKRKTAKMTTWVKIKVLDRTNADKDTGIKKPSETPNLVMNKKSIVVYFSCTDNTKKIAEYIKESTASDIYRIEPSVPYTSADLDYNNAESRTSRENKDTAARPGLSGNLPALDNYEIVYLGYPVWHGQAPKIMYTFVENYDLSGKIIIPFCTSASSGIGASATNLQTVTKGNAIWVEGQRFAGSSTKSEIGQWIQNLDLSKTTTATGTLATPIPRESEPPSASEQPTPTETPTGTPDVSVTRKNIVVYFSCTENTKKIAEYIAESANADIYRIEAAQPYTSADLDYNNSDSRTSKENRDAAARPEIAGELPSLEGYANVYIGYPIWHGQAPKIMYTFVEHYSLSGKMVIPFCTSASSGIGTSATNLQAADSGQAVWLTGKRFSGSAPKSEIEGWVSGLGLQNEQP